jgi:Sortase domain
MPGEPAIRSGPSSYSRRPYWVALAVVTAGFLVSGLVIAGVWRSSSPRSVALQPRRATPSTQQKLPAAVRAAKAAPPGVKAMASRPSATLAVSDIGASGSLLVIPALQVRAPLVPTGASGAPQTASLMIPPDIHTVGWWNGIVHDGDQIVHEDAPAPGQPGVAVIAGHIDSAAAGPGALYHLGELKPGDVVKILDSTGHQSIWTVTRAPQANLKTQLPPELWVTSGPPQLALVTCGGPFDQSTGHYLDNVIVWAKELD